MKFDRMLNKAVRPSEGEMLEFIGSRVDLWERIHNYVKEHYDFKPELAFFTKKYGWTIRYKKSGRTLCYFFPEDGAFSILIVLGAKESANVESIKKKLNKKVRTVFENTEQLRDGRWMWIRMLEKSDIDSLVLLLTAKRKPKDIT
ncbi:MAG: DUF3788 domain-containing protein [bacterium]|nr:DUF3788 domain-containing protein [bacterium]